jgi:hypothetical protein
VRHLRPKQHQQLLLLHQLPPSNLNEKDNGVPGSDELDILVGSRALQVESDDVELSDHIKLILLIARLKAIKRYQELWT